MRFKMFSTAMKLLPLLCLCLLTRSGTTFADEDGPVISVNEGSDVMLPCSLSSKENIEYKRFEWKKGEHQQVFVYDAGTHSNNGLSGQDQQFKGRVSHFQEELKYGNASITITNTKVTDSGNYSCVFPNQQPRQTFHVQLVVVGAAPEPSVKTLNQTKDWALLQCDVLNVSPKPTVEWRNSTGNKLPAEGPQVSERGGSFYISLQTTVMKTDRYRCVATQEEIKHQIYAETFVYIEPVTLTVKEDSDVILPCSLSNKENIETKLFDWRKDCQKVFQYHEGTHYNNNSQGQDSQFKGRVSHFKDDLKYGNASIIIRKTKVTDSGDYSCDFPNLQPRQKFHVQLIVGAAKKPSVTEPIQTKDGMMLECVVEAASIIPTVEWQDSAGKKLTTEKPLVSQGGGYLFINLKTTVKKTANYRCVATQKEISHQIHTDIYVKVNGAAAEPSVRTLDQTNYWALLQCDVLGASPKPTVEWQDSAGNKLPAEEPQVSERGGSFYIILQTTVNKTDTYSCVATQEEIKHQIDAETFVFISGFPIRWIVGAVLVTLLVVGVILAVLVFTGRIKITCKKDEKTTNTGNTNQSMKDLLSKSAKDLDHNP